MNLSEQKGADRKAGAVGFGGHNNAAPADFQVGAVGFGPAWQNDDDGWVELTDKGRRAVTDSMAASIVRLQCEVEERDARIAVLEEQARILVAERDEARIQYRSTEALAMALVKTINEMKEERVDLKLKIESLRDQLCADKCRDKAAADGGWGNI
jgi:hypothetical protein